jgi:Dolichyl-phosphate-mannose-protein mannosyltransferase
VKRVTLGPIRSVVIGLLALLLGLGRWLIPERPLEATGPHALLDVGFALGLLGLVLLLAGGVGQKALRWLRLDNLTQLEQVVFGLPIGLGILAYVVLALGLLGLLRPGVILLWLVTAGVWAWREWSDIVGRLLLGLWQCPQAWGKLGLARRLFLLAGVLMLALVLLQALTPPWDYDGLMYHLQGPRLFLQAGRVLLLPDIWQANFPFTIEMLFTVGLAFGSDTFAKLMHLTYAILLVLGAFAFGQRYLKPMGGWIAAGILMGIPIFPMWASLTHVDMAWALYEFLGLYALTLWCDNNERRRLILSGLATGLALGVKYVALGSAAIFGLWVVWRSRGQGWKTVLVHAALFGVTALLVGSPWYLKNWLEAGNPVYPLVFGGPGWSRQRLDLLMSFLRSFGTGHSVWDYVLLPWNLYFRYQRFAGFMGRIDIPSLLFPLALVYPWARRSRAMDGVAGAMLLRFMVWAWSTQQARFLLPLFPGLSLVASSVLMDLVARPALSRWRRVLTTGLLGGLVVTTLIYSLMLFFEYQPLRVVFGMESKDAFLRRIVPGYAAIRFAQANLSPQARIFMMWDGRGYYCDSRCLPDPEQSRWTYLTLSAIDVSSVTASLRARGVTHLFFSLEDANLLLQQDPTGQHRRAAEFFLREFQPSCTREIYRDKWAFLFELTCT